MGFSLASIVGSGVGAAVSSIATPFADAWVKTKQSQAETHKVDKQTDRDMTIASFQADVQFAQAQRLLAETDRTHWSTRWIRPAFAGLAFVWMGWSVWLWMADDKPLDEIVKYLLSGIVAAIFVLRPFEKNKRSDIAVQAQKTVVPARPTLLSKVTTRRADDQ